MGMQNIEVRFQDFIQFYNKWLDSKPFGFAYQKSACYILKNSGKMIRPQIVLSAATDLKCFNEDVFWMALSIELHHTYTLIHDDLPCMDNDDERRGLPSLHKAFSESHALLLGDVLLSNSYSVLSHLNHRDMVAFQQLVKVYSYLTGPKGLILGQHMDLSAGEYHSKTENIIRLFELKTSRLFQLSLLMPVFISSIENKFDLAKKLFRLGRVCGIIFQLQDDKEDFNADKKSDFNFFQNNYNEATQQLLNYEKQYKYYRNDLYSILPETFTILDKALKLFPS